MSAFTPAEIAYLQSQGLARLATAGPDNQSHVVPVTYRYNPGTDTIDIGGVFGFAKRKKFRDVQRNPRVALVVDDSAGPGRARAIEIRGEAEILDTGGQEIMPNFDPEMFRIRPKRIVAWGIEDEGFQRNARSVP